jgi:hypothetical protein
VLTSDSDKILKFVVIDHDDEQSELMNEVIETDAEMKEELYAVSEFNMSAKNNADVLYLTGGKLNWKWGYNELIGVNEDKTQAVSARINSCGQLINNDNEGSVLDAWGPWNKPGNKNFSGLTFFKNSYNAPQNEGWNRFQAYSDGTISLKEKKDLGFVGVDERGWIVLTKDSEKIVKFDFEEDLFAEECSSDKKETLAEVVIKKALSIWDIFGI